MSLEMGGEVFEDAHVAKEKERLNFVLTLSYTVELCLFGDLDCCASAERFVSPSSWCNCVAIRTKIK